MPPVRGARNRLSLIGQLLVFQFSLLTVVLLAVSATSLQQATLSFERSEGRRLLTVAEYTASLPVIRYRITTDAASRSLTPSVAALRTTTGVDSLILTRPDGYVLASPDDPRLSGTTLLVPDAQASQNRGWKGTASLGPDVHLVARAPVFADDGTFIGVALAGKRYPTVWQTITTAGPDLLTYLAVAGILGALGSVWFARRMKRQTLGLEPSEIATLVEHREAMLHGIREGVIAVDADGVITLANDSATQLLRLPADAAGRPVTDVGLDDAAVHALSRSDTDASDVLLINDGALLVLNQTQIHPTWSASETVTTLRDHTQLVSLQHELGTSKQSTDTLRAQTHDFANRLHTISMLIQLGEHDSAVQYIQAVSRDRTASHETVLQRIADPTIAAVLIAKMSLARERGAVLELSRTSTLGKVGDDLAADVVTVLGNLIDNAFDAVALIDDAESRKVLIDVLPGDASDPRADGVRIAVHDSGPGVPPELSESLFLPKVSSKSTGGSRGFGLSIVSLVVTRRGGRISVHNDNGARFEVDLPVKEVFRV